MFDPFTAPGLRYVGDISLENVNHGHPLPVFEPVSPKNRPGIRTPEGFEAACARVNRRAFVSKFGREPKDDAELDAWVWGGATA